MPPWWLLQVSASEPLVNFLPVKKNLVQRYVSWAYLHFLTFLAVPVEFTKRLYLGKPLARTYSILRLN
jgi:hypothetical protein